MDDSLPTLNIRELERLAIEQAMKQASGSVAKAAKLLGIGRATLYRRLHEDPPLTLRTGEAPSSGGQS
jgi:transcriptional regulator of acetoin/glycerol metabolism